MDDISHHLTRLLEEAAKVVADAELPESFRSYAFERALDVLLAEAGFGLRGQARVQEPALEPEPEHRQARAVPPVAPAGLAPSPLARLALRASLDVGTVRDVYRLEGGELSLVLGERTLDRNKATSSRQLTLLVAGGRQAAGFEEWTPLAHARAVCSLYNRLDSKNYAATVKSMADVFNFHGQGVQREVRLTKRGWDEWSALVRQFAARADA